MTSIWQDSWSDSSNTVRGREGVFKCRCLSWPKAYHLTRKDPQINWDLPWDFWKPWIHECRATDAVHPWIRCTGWGQRGAGKQCAGPGRARKGYAFLPGCFPGPTSGLKEVQLDSVSGVWRKCFWILWLEPVWIHFYFLQLWLRPFSCLLFLWCPISLKWWVVKSKQRMHVAVFGSIKEGWAPERLRGSLKPGSGKSLGEVQPLGMPGLCWE